ncbi:muscarinic acetylcholine receptor M4 [Coregonus clupeaformis]|uniref:muscarinic acetylcholine receptor M4 n=1 Tax=Coregonus clupeaformis TaxID=59861 RepID=UPI001BDFEBAD|nr:muscarinic acetylcholine receptor M4 [Coregonus clupeaformis]
MVTSSLSFITVLGNVLVMLSIKVNRHLQTVNNYFLFSLACADLIIGLLSMNLYTLYIVKGYWPLGAVICDLWLALDYVVSNASVMNLLIISFDRYFCVTRPLTYPARRTTRLAGLMIAAAWLLSLFLWAPAILFWQSLVGKRIVPDGECYIQLLSNPAVTLGMTLPAFYLPAVIMIVLYTRISFASRSRLTAELQSRRARTSSGRPKQGSHLKRSCVLSQRDTEPKSDLAISIEAETSICATQGIIKALKDSTEQASNSVIPTSGVPPSPDHLPSEINQDCRWSNSRVTFNHTGDENSSATKVSQPSSILNGSNTTSQLRKVFSPFPSFSKTQAKRKRRIVARERKVTKTIFAILLAFILTWTPYSVIAIIGTYCHFCVPETVWTMGYWLCYINSTVNPVCYALCNVTFRKTFKNLLRCQYRNTGVK